MNGNNQFVDIWKNAKIGNKEARERFMKETIRAHAKGTHPLVNRPQ